MGRGHGLDRREDPLLEFQVLRDRLDDDVRLSDRILQRLAGPYPVRGGDVQTQPLEIAANLIDDPGPAVGIGLLDIDRVTDGGEDLCDPMPHQPRTDDSNTLACHALCLPP